VKRHVLELVGAVLLCLATFFSYPAQIPISLPLIGTGSGVAPNSDALAPVLVSIPELTIRWRQFSNFCVGLCMRQEYLQ